MNNNAAIVETAVGLALYESVLAQYVEAMAEPSGNQPGCSLAFRARVGTEFGAFITGITRTALAEHIWSVGDGAVLKIHDN